MDTTDILKEGMANLWKGKESVGGKLYLTSTSLHHKPHKINIQKGEVEIKLDDMERVDVYNNKLLGIPITNGLLITDKSGKEYKFVVYKRKEWKKEIEDRLS